MTNEWIRPEHVEAYLARMHDIPHRAEGESTLLSEVPTCSKRVLDLGCGDGHLLNLVLTNCPDAVGVGLDLSSAMLEQARQRFTDDKRVTLVDHNMDDPLPALGTFDCVVSSFAIHHCTHARKREIYTEVFEILEDQGVFCNLEHVASPNDRIHARFVSAMGMTPDDEDPSNKLLDVETQLGWLRSIGFDDVACHWKWRELALLAARKSPADQVNETHEPVKQVIVVRHDLKMRRGKQIAQGSHASMSFMCRRLSESESLSFNDFSVAQRSWLSHSFAKVCCRVDSEQELMDIYDKALEAGLEVHLITDSGKTEFHGRPTNTCLAIGPDQCDKIDAITGDLPLL